MTLEQRLARLERRNRWVTAALGVATVFGLVAVVSGFAVAPPKRVEKALCADEVVCNRLRIRDDSGKDRIVLDVRPGYAISEVGTPAVAMTPTIILMTAGGQTRVQIVGSETVGGRVAVHDVLGREIGSLSNGPHAARLDLRNRGAKDGIHLAAHSTGNYVIVHGDSGEQRIVLGQERAPIFRVKDGGEQVVLELSPDEQGVLRWSRPESREAKKSTERR